MTTKTAPRVALALTLVMGAGVAFAQDAAIDTDGDGLYSFPELQVVMPDLTGDGFSALDTSGDGLLDAAEIATATDAGLLPVMDG